MGAWYTEHTDAADRSAWSELLPRWDELSTEALQALETDPVHGPDLRMLQRAEDWLHSQCTSETACPSAEELYDHGRGPGALALTEERRRSITAHLANCAECEALTATLELTPPLPLDLSLGGAIAPELQQAPAPDLPVAPIPIGTQAPPAVHPQPTSSAPVPQPATGELPILTHPRWRRNVQRLAPAAAAAGLLALGLLITREAIPSFAQNSITSAPLLRGVASGPLLFPRGPVLAQCGFDQAPTFEVAEQTGASEYRVVLRRHDGGAFSEGEEILKANGPGPTVQADLALAPGHYTWEAWVIVDGLDRSLGSRDFDVVEDAQMLERADGISGPERVRLLHAAGFPSDARHLARTLPESEFRAEYLQLVPGR